jgi:GH25 family lysozyme M1 (1,4-beta-N-acetylmuramidase)
MIIKEPCIIDTSHWDVPNWDILDPRVVGVIMKATQGRYYVDPTFADQWNGAKQAKRPRSAFHFMELNDVSAQVENFLTACEDAGAIVSGRWMGEIEPVLDAEIELASATSHLLMAITKPKLSQKKLLDLQKPEQHLTRNPAMRVRGMRADLERGSFADLTSAVTASQLAAQYKAWLDLVEAELHVRPILYASRWTLAVAGSPAWVADYEGWWAQYPYDPDGQSAPSYLPNNATGWWAWQYSDRGELQGFAGDVSVFNGTKEEWAAKYGGIVIPPIGETMEISPKDLSGSKIRSGPGTQYPQVGSLLYGQKKTVNALLGTAGSEQWAEVTHNAQAAYIAVWHQGEQTAVLSGALPPVMEPTRTHVIEVFSDGMISVDGGARQ